MAVIKEWKCQDCNRFFESAIPVCIHCGSENILRVFLTAPALKGDKTKLTDRNLRILTAQSGLTDYSNNPSTRHEKDNSTIWKPVPKDGKKNLKIDGQLAAAVGGGMNVTSMHSIPGGQFEAIKHAEDLK